MNKVQTRKKSKIQLLLIILISLFLCVAVLNSLPAMNFFAKAEEETEFKQIALDISNNSFANYSGSSPATPSDWTKTLPPKINEGNEISGVINSSTYINYIDAIKLSSYPEYKTTGPVTPFHPSGNPYLGDKNFLMINTNSGEHDQGTILTYKSSELSLAANKFYKVSAWVKTGDFAQDSGASIRLDGLNQNMAFTDINTVRSIPKDSNNIPDLKNDPKVGQLGWREYAFYVATSPIETNTVTVTLGVGDYYHEEKDDLTIAEVAKGYAFFDNIAAYEISSTDYNFFKDSKNEYIEVADLALTSAFTAAEQEKFSFGNNSLAKNWTRETAEGADSGYGIWETIDADSEITADNELGIEKDPVSSTGKLNTDDKLNDALIVSTYDKNSGSTAKAFKTTAVGRRSPEISIKRFGYYRLSVWVKTENIKGASGATLIVTTDRYKEGSTDEKQTFEIPNCTGTAELDSRYGWKEQAFYIKGSSFSDNKITLGLWLGIKDSLSGGVAMFHNIRFDKLTYDEFTANSAENKIVTFDEEVAANNNGVTNGSFYTAGSYDEYKFPMPAASWTKINPLTAGTAGQSLDIENLDYKNVIAGIVPIDETHFNENSGEYGGLTYLDSFKELNQPNVLMISNTKKKTAVGYASSDITVTTATSAKISVSLYTANMEGYGANLVLKSGGKIISTIEKIQTTYSSHDVRGFQTFNFYAQSGAADSNLVLEIWLGLSDKDQNMTKRSTGTILVSSVSSVAIENTEFAAAKTAFENERTSNTEIKTINNPAYSFDNEDFSYYDNYEDSTVKSPYNWSLSAGGTNNIDNVVYGIFNSDKRKENDNLIPSHFSNIDYNDKGERIDVNKNILMLYNPSPTASIVNLDKSMTLEAGTFYKISLTIKVDINDPNSKSIGASIALKNTKFAFENIKDTSTKIDSTVDKETFRTFSFYIKVGDTALSTGLQVGLGGTEYSDQICSGRVYIRNLDIADITNTIYDEAVANYNDKEYSSEKKAYMFIADNSVPNTVTEPDGATPVFNWWLVPSILVSVALVLALLGVVVRKIYDDRVKNRKVRLAVNESDRTITLNRLHDTNANLSSSKAKEYFDKQYEEFDDILPPAPSTLKSKSTILKSIQPIVVEKEELSDNVVSTVDNNSELEVEQTAETTESDYYGSNNDYLDEFDD